MKAILLLTLCIAVVSIALCIAAESSDNGFFYFVPSRHQIYYGSCNSDSDCTDNQCCIQQHPKKDGYCRPLGREGEGCSEFHMCARTASDKFCPCRESLVCERNPYDSFPRHTCQEKKT